MILMVTQKVKDFDVWKPVFEEHQSVRQRHGAEGHAIYRAKDEPNLVTVIMRYPSVEAAKAFAADPSLKEAMERGGVEGMPTVSMWDETEMRQY